MNELEKWSDPILCWKINDKSKYKYQLIMDNPVIPMIHPLAGEDCSDKVKIVFGEDTIGLTEFGTRLCDEYGGEIQIGESKRLLIDCLRKIEEFLSIILNDGCFDASYQLIGSKILDRILSGDRFYDEVKFLIGEEEIALMQLKRYLLQDMFPRTIVINGENWVFRSILNTIQNCLREYEKVYEDLYKNQVEEELRKKREELKNRLLIGEPVPFCIDENGIIQHKEETEELETKVDNPISLKGDRLIGTSQTDEILSQSSDEQQDDALDVAMCNQRIAAKKSDYDKELEKERKELLVDKERKELLERVFGRDPLLPWKPKTETRHSSPIEFLSEANQFQKFIERYFFDDEIFGEFGEKFPIKSYMSNIYDMIRLLEDNQKFRCTYTKDGLGGWMNILAVNKGEGNLEDSIKQIISEHFKKPGEKSYNKETWQFGKLIEYLDSLSAKKRVYTSFSEMGCLQYLHFIEFGEAFAFYWHAASRRKYVLTSVSDIQSIYNRFKGDSNKLCNKLWKIIGNAESLLKSFKCDDDLKPTIVMRDEKCSIGWVEFHTHEGVFQRRYELDKTMLRCNSDEGINEFAVPSNIKLVNNITHLRMIPLFRY